MRKQLTPAQRLIVAADFSPKGDDVSSPQVRAMALARSLQGTGACFKVNSLLRAYGYGLIPRIHEYQLQVFADLKLCDIPATLTTDAAFLRAFAPDLLTVMCGAGVQGMAELKKALPDVRVIGVTALTSLLEADTMTMHRRTPISTVRMFADLARSACLDGLVCSPKEIAEAREAIGDGLVITPGVRFNDAQVAGDDQNPDRVMTPAGAIAAGADMVVMGRPITQSHDPYASAMRAIEEIASVTG